MEKGDLVTRCIQANLPVESVSRKVKPGYIGKQKGAIQIAFERGFFDSSLKLNGLNITMQGTLLVDGTRDKTTLAFCTCCNHVLT